MYEIRLLGTGGMLPLKNRFLTSLYAEYNGRAVLIDCGEGTQVAFGVHGLKMSRIDTILITHCHADHITGLPGLLLSIGNCSREEPLDIYFPESAERIIRNMLSVCDILPYKVHLHGLSEKNTSVFRPAASDTLPEVSALPLSHRVPCLGYSLKYYKKPVFDTVKADALGVPLKMRKVLHSGKPVTLENGVTVRPDDVISGKRPPLKITYVTDTLPIPSIAQFAEGSQLLVCEGMYGDVSKKQSMNEKRHMLMQDACRIAAESHSERLWLTHYSPAESDPAAYKKELAEIFPAVTVSRDGEEIAF